jgi:hypothetical protein
MNIDLNNLKMTDEEEQQLAWCYANLEDIQSAEIEDEAYQFAMMEINAPIAADKLLELLVNVIVRNAEERSSGKKRARRTTNK